MRECWLPSDEKKTIENALYRHIEGKAAGSNNPLIRTSTVEKIADDMLSRGFFVVGIIKRENYNIYLMEKEICGR
ncbi:hypothetical protein COV19_05300 [Candidatus Woesearchaeota archaeon CG10_big_fil_rev_8_21_14_0_10_44_13]|nr:MAG: hypothetical protein COV19_05300 [Candidatus Woesearchaeota archaeon CG10_big_fil_rev_8_21_14_0_10_44_13]